MHTHHRAGAVLLTLVLAACSSVDREPAAAKEPAPPPATGQALPKAADAAGNLATQRLAPQGGLAELAYAPAPCCWLPPAEDRENYAHEAENPVHLAGEQPVSTFSIDVDTASYANVRRFLNDGQLPPEHAVRVEELVNYFPYTYPVPATRDRPFSITTALAPAPWDARKVLLQVALKGYEVPAAKRAPANLVFLVDVSGSMQDPAKLPLLKSAFRLMTSQLKATDRVALVVYAGAAGTVLEPTPGDQQAKIRAALDRLEAGGSTNGGEGIRLAYDLAREGFIRGGINRIVLATDGDFNVGTTDFDALIDLVEREREDGVSLTTLGFGTGNYNDQLVERLADAGNGNHAYIDTLAEGRKVLVEQLTGTLQTIAKDVKVQVEFNPAEVAEYRLIGYENRALDREDFNNDRVDAGEIGAGHTVTALYELTLEGSAARLVDPLRYGARPPPRDPAPGGGELAYVRLRYKVPEGDTSRLIEQPVQRAALRPLGAAPELRFAAAVAAFGQKLRGSDYLGSYSWADIAALAAGARGDDPEGYRGEFVSLVRLADTIEMADGRPGTPTPSPGPAPEAARLRH
ncbi:MAG: VWA domain-containing protein [Gammaproteobacteria bacterium]|nr:VWA domain-containing protein [Gammaproteobacteria bacterium]